MKLAAIVYQEAQGHQADDMLVTITQQLEEAGHKLAGAVQINSQSKQRSRCDMSLKDLATKKVIEVSEYRGAHARGCRLDQQALEDAVGLAFAAVEADPDLLIVNKFGKRESEGHGFRQTIEAAIAKDIPVVTCVGPESLAAWKKYTSSTGSLLPLNLDVTLAWCKNAIEGDASKAS